MLRVLPEEPSGYEFNLSELQKKLEKISYWGKITIEWKQGQIVLIREERVLRPSESDKFY